MIDDSAGPPDPRPPFAAAPVAAIATAFLVAHLAAAASGAYGFHRDELLYLAMGQHLRVWRMDFPPGIALLAQFLRHTVGDSLVAVRAVPALASSALAVLAACAARELGGGRAAQALAALAIVTNPLFMRAGALFQPVVLDQVAWTLGYLALLAWRRTGDARWWLGVGAAAGLGLLVKFSVAFFGFGVLVAVLALPERRVLLTRWPWLAALLAFALGAPSVVGQLALHFPVLGQMHDLRATQLERTGPADFLAAQVTMGPAFALGVAGALALIASSAYRRWRVVGLACTVAFLTLMALHGKGYYAGPVFPVLGAAGAAWLERRARRWSTVRPRVVWRGSYAACALWGLLVLPLGFPFLPPAPMARYAHALGAGAAVRTNTGELLALPQDYADMLGWEDQARTLATVYRSLPPADRVRAAIIAGNYGEAGAIDYYAGRYSIPGAVSPAGSYWFFGPGRLPGDVALVVSGNPDVRATLDQLFARCAPAALLDEPWSVPEEQHVTVWHCEGPHRSLQALWPSLAGRN